MKMLGRVISLVLVCALMVLAPWALETAVVDVKEHLRPEQPVWEGVLSVAVVPSFPTVNANGWLSACFRAFEKQEGNVLVSLREMTEIGVRTGAAAESLPDVLLFGMGVFDEPEQLFVRMEGQAELKAGLDKAGMEGDVRYAVPAAMGGYALLGNRALLDAAGWSPQMGFAETMALLEQKDMAVAAPEMPYTHSLEAFEAMGDAGGVRVDSGLAHAKIWPDFVLEKKYAFYVATQREVRRMQVLQSAGRGFDTVLLTPEGPVYVDQVLLAGMVRPELTAAQGDDEYRAQWIGRLIRFLLQEESQRGVSQAGLFPVTNLEGVYEAGTQMAQIEASLTGEMICAETFR